MWSAFLISFNLHLCSLTPLAWEAKQSGQHHAVLKTAFSFRNLRLGCWVKFIIPPSPLLQDLPEGFKTPRANQCLLGSKLYSQTWSNTSKHQGRVWCKLKLEPSLHADTDDLCIMDHFVGGGGKERQLKNGWHSGGVFTSWVIGPFIFVYTMKILNKMLLWGVPQHLISPTRDRTYTFCTGSVNSCHRTTGKVPEQLCAFSTLTFPDSEE